MRSRCVRLGGFEWFMGMLAVGLSAVGAPLQNENLAQNPSFEILASETNSIPAEWIDFSSDKTLIQTTTEAAQSGRRSVKLTAQGVPAGYLGLIQSLPVLPETVYTFSVHVLNNRTNCLDAGATGCINIEWKNADGREIRRIDGPWWSNDLSTVWWQEFKVSGRSPENVTTANFVVFLFDDADGSRGSFFVDEARIVKK